MHYIELAATITGVVQGVLVMLNKKSNWIFHLASNICLVIFSFYTKLYADTIEDIIYVLMSLWGLVTWYNIGGFRKNKVEKQTSWCTNKERLIYVSLIMILWLSIFIVLTNTDDVSPVLDAFTTASGLIATLMMANRKIESWIVWFVNDCVYVYLYFTLEEPALGLTVMNLMWVFMAVGSFMVWTKDARKDKMEGLS